ncbi:hypothetical protein B0H66DRAFT_578353 [Apodospora peruviana]|uniref:Uncharacterized protein n=1 Tax=Apodospora peruviana TaxID=516989 RepID=A0AAE0HUN6_9PEZI|nr:hypothetical protein B0H66DRAFT_578353 [Apodospora peruviana]
MLPLPGIDDVFIYFRNILTTPIGTTTSWQPEPNGRGTFSLVFSCIVTLTLCVWSALHLNVPAENTSLRKRFIEKTKWVLYGIFAPELVVATAAAQYTVARWLMKEIEKDAKYRGAEHNMTTAGPNRPSSHTWDMTQCFYAVMGGFAADSPWVDFRSREAPAASDSIRKRVVVTPEGIRLLSFLGRLPQIQESQIEDKSKADWMAKAIICMQAGWMVVQVLGRAIKQMPVSLLEVNTCGHVACALAIYLLWWSKPLDIQVPTVLDDEADSDALSLMYLCSSIGAVNSITDIRCFIHVATDQDENLWRPPNNNITDSNVIGPEYDAAPSEAQITTYLSVGSPGSRYPSRFLGFNELWSDRPSAELVTSASTLSTTTASENRAFRYNFNLTAPPIAAECRVYYFSPYTDPPQPSLRHSRYCRRVFPDAKSPPGQPHVPLPPALLSSASKAADKLRAECDSSSRRPTYGPYYFTTVPSLGCFLGETDYIVRPRIVNFPSLHNLGLGQVNIHRDRLRSVLAFTAAAYGALHCSGWASPEAESYPTSAERVLWIVSSLTIAASGALLWAFFSARQLWPAFDRWWSGVTPGVHIESVRRQKGWVIACKRWSMYVVLALFALARICLVVEAFVSLRRAPVGLYETPEWTDFLPHL